MKKLHYYCPQCKADIDVAWDKEIIPASVLHITCRSQAWLRKIEDVKEDGQKAKKST
jgi:hypothetical protein